MFIVGCLKPSRHVYDMQCAKYNRCKNTIILLVVVVSKCRLNVNSKLSINVTCNKGRLKILVLHLMIQMDMNSNDFTHPELAEDRGKIVCHCRIPFNLSSTQKLVYAQRKHFFKHLMESRRAFYGFEFIIYLV